MSQPLLRDKHFLLSHDAATGYVGLGVFSPDSLIPATANFIKTQDRGFAEQLNCGARALDLRLGFENQNGPLKFHHAKYYMEDQTVQNTMPEIKQWAQENPDELVILLLSHCFGGVKQLEGMCKAHEEKITEPFTNAHIRVVTNRSALQDMTVMEAEQLARLKGGGMVLAIFADDEYVDSTYEAAINNGVVGTYDQANGTVDYHWDALWSYAAQELYPHPGLWQLQGIWQETDAVRDSYKFSITGGNIVQDFNFLGEFFYSIEGQTEESGINTRLREKVEAGWFEKGNFLLMNFVSTEGTRIAHSFGASSKGTCYAPAV